MKHRYDEIKFEDGEKYRGNLNSIHIIDALSSVKKGDIVRLTGTLYAEKRGRGDKIGKILHEVEERQS